MYKIMIADDNRIICNGIKQTLEREGLELDFVGTYYDGAELIKAIKKQTPDILITDIEMPQKTGLDVSSYLKKHRPSVKIIFITGYQKFEYAKFAIDNRIAYFLVKPYTSTELINAVQACMESIRKQKENAIKESCNYVEDFGKNKEYIRSAFLSPIPMTRPSR